MTASRRECVTLGRGLVGCGWLLGWDVAVGVVAGLPGEAFDGDVGVVVVVGEEGDDFVSADAFDAGDEVLAHGGLVGLAHVEYDIC